MRVDVYFDGASNNHLFSEAVMGVGMVLFLDGEIMIEKAIEAGKGSSNEAEWYGCVLALKAACKFLEWAKGEGIEIEEVNVYSDSQLIVNQFHRHYAIKHLHFLPYYTKAKMYESQLGSLFGGLHWIKREKNKHADKLSKIARIAQEK